MHDLIQNSIYLGAALTGLATWYATNLIGKPILAVRDARLEALRVAERYAYVAGSASEETVRVARSALADTTSRLRSLCRGQGWPARLYCRFMSYNLEGAAIAINGLCQMAGEHFHEQTRQNNLNYVYYSLNTYGHIAEDKLLLLKAALAEHSNKTM
ncbi:MAG: hypothetical protein WCD20_00755 [Rhodomicrobium sp.]